MIRLNKRLAQVIILNTPSGKVFPTIEKVEKCVIKIDECSTRINLVVLDIKDYDGILGIDWLSK